MRILDIEEINEMLDKTDKGQNKGTITNIVTILENDELLSGAVKYNKFSYELNIVKGMPWPRESAKIEDRDIDHIRYYIESNYGINNEKNLITAINVVADKNQFHPVVDYLNSLQWDGKDRLSEAMSVYLGAERSDINTEFLTVFMLGAINRVFYPGCKFEMMLNFTGEQGVGKSTFLRFLAVRDEWFCDDISNMSDDMICRRLMAHWIVELSEMVATANSKSIEATKAQISRMKDTYKIPYDRFAKDFPRQCVFAGTTNKHEFLPPDKTGNRRYLPVVCSRERREKMILDNEKESREYIDQLWAQAMYIFKTENPPLKLSDKTEAYLREYQEQFMQDDFDEGKIVAWFEDTDHDRICTMMIYKECLGQHDKPANYTLNNISETVDACIRSGKIVGYEKVTKAMRMGEYGVQKGWKKIKPPEYEQELFDGPFGPGILIN